MRMMLPRLGGGSKASVYITRLEEVSCARAAYGGGCYFFLFFIFFLFCL
jgi:hypothetical protein